MPVIFIYGSDDWLTRYTIKSYVDDIKAPSKEIICIPAAGHDVLQLQSKEFYKALSEALNKIK